MLEVLEDRFLLSTVYVVPANAPTDKTHVLSLSDAMTAVKMYGFDTIQIEPQSVPGGVDLSMPPYLPLPASVSIQGDPNFPVQALPQLDKVSLGVIFPATSFGLAHLNLTFVYITNGQLTDDTITGTVEASDSQALVAVKNCLFLHSASAPPVMLQLSNTPGAIVSGNTFISAEVDDTAVEIDSTFGVTVANNTIMLLGGGGFATGILVQNSFSDTSAELDDNSIQTSTKGGLGILTIKSPDSTLNVKIAGNDLQQNFVGLAVIGDGTFLGTIDAGSNGGSPGGNKFQGFTPNPNGRVAIDTLLATTGTVQAHFNIWSVFDPQTVVSPTPGTTIATGTFLSFSPIGVLSVFLDLSAASFNLMDNGQGGLGVAFNRGVTQTFAGIRQITVESGVGSHSISYELLPAVHPAELLPAVRPADLQVHLGLEDSFTLSAAVGLAGPPPARLWMIDVNGRGDNQVRTSIGALPVRLAVQLGTGTNLADLTFSGIGHMPLPETVAVSGGQGNNDIRVSYAFLVTPQAQMSAEAPLTVNVSSGTGRNAIRISYALSSAISARSAAPVSPLPTFAIPLQTTVKSGPGPINLAVSYATSGTGSPIVFTAPVLLDVSGGWNNVIRVTFGPSAASLPGLVASPAPVLNSLFRMRLQGGPGPDTIAAMLFFAASSRGQVDAVVQGGAGNDHLTLDSYGPSNPTFLHARINGGPGFDTAQLTANVAVENCESGTTVPSAFLEPRMGPILTVTRT
jgi:hypothetical protein